MQAIPLGLRRRIESPLTLSAAPETRAYHYIEHRTSHSTSKVLACVCNVCNQSQKLAEPRRFRR
jgi:hypothetical protein